MSPVNKIFQEMAVHPEIRVRTIVPICNSFGLSLDESVRNDFFFHRTITEEEAEEFEIHTEVSFDPEEPFPMPGAAGWCSLAPIFLLLAWSIGCLLRSPPAAGASGDLLNTLLLLSSARLSSVRLARLLVPLCQRLRQAGARPLSRRLAQPSTSSGLGYLGAHW